MVESNILATTSALGNVGGIEGAVTTQRGVIGSIDTKATPRHDEGKRVRVSLGGPTVRSVSRDILVHEFFTLSRGSLGA